MYLVTVHILGIRRAWQMSFRIEHDAEKFIEIVKANGFHWKDEKRQVVIFYPRHRVKEIHLSRN